MRVIYGKIGKIKHLDDNLCVTIGNFDGVHLGHQELINRCIKSGLKSCVITFNPHPLCVLQNNFKYYFLTNLKRKIELIRKLNPDYLLIIDFNRKAALTKKEEFITWLKDLGVKKIVCGMDAKFAYKNECGINDLKDNFDVEVAETKYYKSKRISSSLVKQMLEEGKIKEANILLSRNYTIEGMVIEGFHNGQKLGYRTANLDILGNVAPKCGVYAVYVIHKHKKYLGMCNVGFNPTIGKLKTLKLETHIFNFDEMIYGDDIKVLFIDYIREETKFNSLDELRNQLENDMKYIVNNFNL